MRINQQNAMCTLSNRGLTFRRRGQSSQKKDKGLKMAAEAKGTNSSGWSSSHDDNQPTTIGGATQDEMPAENSEPKRRRFSAFHAVRKIFRRKSKPPVKEGCPKSTTLKSQSTGELSYLVSNSLATRHLNTPASTCCLDFPEENVATSYNGLSLSHDSIFAPEMDENVTSPKKIPNQSGFSYGFSYKNPNLQEELANKIKTRHIESDEDDAGLPHSPSTSPTTDEVLHQGLMRNCNPFSSSDGSLLSMGSSETDNEDGAGPMKLIFDNSGNDPDLDVGTTFLLSNSAAKHKIACRPRRMHTISHQSTTVTTTSLPIAPEINEEKKAASPNSQDEKLPLSQFNSTTSKTSPLNSPPPVVPRSHSVREVKKNVVNEYENLAEITAAAKLNVKQPLDHEKWLKENHAAQDKNKVSEDARNVKHLEKDSKPVAAVQEFNDDDDKAVSSCLEFTLCARKDSGYSLSNNSVILEKADENRLQRSNSRKEEDARDYGFTGDSKVIRTKAVGSMLSNNIAAQVITRQNVSMDIPIPDYDRNIGEEANGTSNANDLNLFDAHEKKDNYELRRSNSVKELRANIEKNIAQVGIVSTQNAIVLQSPEPDYDGETYEHLRRSSSTVSNVIVLEELRIENSMPTEVLTKGANFKKAVSPPKDYDLNVDIVKANPPTSYDSRRLPIYDQLTEEEMQIIKNESQQSRRPSPAKVVVASAKDVSMPSVKTNVRPVSLPSEKHLGSPASITNFYYSTQLPNKIQTPSSPFIPKQQSLPSRKSSCSSTDSSQSSNSTMMSSISEYSRKSSVEILSTSTPAPGPSPLAVLNEVVPIIINEEKVEPALKSDKPSIRRASSFTKTVKDTAAPESELMKTEENNSSSEDAKEKEYIERFGVKLRKSKRVKKVESDSYRESNSPENDQKNSIVVPLRPVSMIASSRVQEDTAKEPILFGQHILKSRSSSLANVHTVNDSNEDECNEKGNATSGNDISLEREIVKSVLPQENNVSTAPVSTKEASYFKISSQFQRKQSFKSEAVSPSSLFSNNVNLEIVQVPLQNTPTQAELPSKPPIVFKKQLSSNEKLNSTPDVVEVKLRKSSFFDETANSKIGNSFISSINRRPSFKSVNVEHNGNKESEEEKKSFTSTSSRAFKRQNSPIEIKDLNIKISDSSSVTEKLTSKTNVLENVSSASTSPEIRKTSINDKTSRDMNSLEKNLVPINAPSVSNGASKNYSVQEIEKKNPDANVSANEGNKSAKSNETVKTGTSNVTNIFRKSSINYKAYLESINADHKIKKPFDKNDMSIISDSAKSQSESAAEITVSAAATSPDSNSISNFTIDPVPATKVPSSEINKSSINSKAEEPNRIEKPNPIGLVQNSNGNNSSSTPEWKKLVHQRKEKKEMLLQQEKEEALLKASTTFIIEPEVKQKPVRSSKVLSMVNNFQNPQECL